MIRIDDPANLGPAIEDIRAVLGISRRDLARQIAERTGRAPDTVNAQLWSWERQHRVPDLRSLGPALEALGYHLALIPTEAP